MTPLDANRFDAIDIMALLGLLVLVIAVNNLAKRQAWPIPEAILTMAVGMIAGSLITLLPEGCFSTFRKLDQAAAMQFLAVWLAPIIFAEGYSMKTTDFFANITRILAHAFVGTAVSSFVVAAVVFYLPPVIGVTADFQLSFTESLTFGALISATDPVTTLAIFKDQRLADLGLGHLYYSVLGESVLNDAVGITLFASFSKLVMRGQASLSGSDMMAIAIEFTWTFAGSMLIGGAVGLAIPLILKSTSIGGSATLRTAGNASTASRSDHCQPTLEHDAEEQEMHINVPELGVMLVLAMLPYLLAEAFDLSGIVAIMFAGMTARYYAHHNLTVETRLVFLPIVELIAQLCETYVFIILGLGVFLFQGHYSGPLVLAAVVGCLVGRAAHVYPLSSAVNRFSNSEPFQKNEQHLLWFAGLRGAIAFICAFSFPETASSRHRYSVICTTIVIVGSSTVLMGWTTRPVMRFLGIQGRSPAPGVAVEDRIGLRPSCPRFSHRRMLSAEAQATMENPIQRAAYSHRRQRSAPHAAHLLDINEKPNRAATYSQSSSPGLSSMFKRMDYGLRRFVSTEDAIISHNKDMLGKQSRRGPAMLGQEARLTAPMLQADKFSNV